MAFFEHAYYLRIGILSIGLPERNLLPVLKILHKLFPNKKWFIKIKWPDFSGHFLIYTYISRFFNQILSFIRKHPFKKFIYVFVVVSFTVAPKGEDEESESEATEAPSEEAPAEEISETSAE